MQFWMAVTLGVYLLVFGMLWGWFVRELKYHTDDLTQLGLDRRSHLWHRQQRHFWNNMGWAVVWPVALVYWWGIGRWL